METDYHERHLPHWQAEGAALFITWRLQGSLPKEITYPPSDQHSGKRFAEVDRILARAAEGPRWLEQEKIARVVYEALIYGQDHLHLYELYAWVIMPNHVHILIDPQADLANITKSIKGFSARRANLL